METIYKNLLERTNDGVLRYYLDSGQVIYANPNIIHIFDLNLPLNELQGKPLKDLMFRYKHEEMKAILEQNGEYHDYDYHFRTAKGKDKWVICDAYLSTDPSTNQRVVEAIIRDVTDRKLTEKSLMDSGIQYRSALDSMTDAIHVVDRNLRLILLNSTFMRWVNELSLDADPIGKTIFEVFPFLPERVREEYHRVFDTKQQILTEETTRIGNRDITTETRKIPIIEKGEVRRVITVVRDITELRRLEERLRNLAENVPVGIYYSDLNGLLLYGNKKAEEAIGYSRNDVLGKNLFDIGVLKPESKEKAVQLIERNRRGENTGPDEIVITAKDGSEKTIEIRTEIVSLGKEKVILGMLLDVTSRKEAEKVLLESKGFLANIFSSIQDGINVGDKKFTILSVNSVMEKWYAHAMPLIGKKCYEAYHGRSEPCQICPVRKTLNTGQPAMEVVPRIGPNKEITGWLDLYSFPMIDTRTGELKGVIEYVRDISEQKKYKDKVEESEKKYRTLAEAANDFIFISDREGTIKYVNTFCASEFNTKPSDLVGKNIGELFPPETSARQLDNIKKVFDTKKSFSVENHTAFPKRALWLDTWLIPLKNKSGDSEAVLGVSRDVTARKMTEDELKKERDKAHEYLRIAGVIFLAIDRDQMITMINKKGCEILGYRPEEIIGKNWFDTFIPDTERDKVRQYFMSMISGAAEFSPYNENYVITKDKKRRIIAWYNTTITDEKGNITGTLSSGEDITERKRIEEELVTSNKRLKQLVLRDPHTGLYNHRYLAEAIEVEYYRARRHATPLSIIMVDIDYFKSINDLYGHHFGDLVLSQFSKQLKRLVRQYDIVIRYGGEEFVIVSPGADGTTAMNLSQRLLDAINLYNFGNKKHVVKLKLSIAVVSYPEDLAPTGADMIQTAEKILDKVKERGGNNIFSSGILGRTKAQTQAKDLRGKDVQLLKSKIDKLKKRTNRDLLEAVFAFAKTLELKDHYTGEHVERTVQYASNIAKTLGLSEDDVENIKQAAMLHDLGKIGISEKILQKKHKLSKHEFGEIKKHSQIGADILRPIQVLHKIIPFVLYHHERWDGKGYPNGLKGEEIPLGARIIALADVYQALSSDRPYRKALKKKKILNIIKEGAGSQFDPKIAEAFLKVLMKQSSASK